MNHDPGNEFEEPILDEVVRFKPYRFQREAMERVLLAPTGKITIYSTPTRSNWFYEAYQRVKEENEAIILGSNGVKKFKLLFDKYFRKGIKDGKSANHISTD